MSVQAVGDRPDGLAVSMSRTPTEHIPLPRGPVTWHTARAELLAAADQWEHAYHHLRAALRLLDRNPATDELDRLRREHAAAHEQSRRDALTAVFNRRYLDERLVALLGDSTRSGTGGVSLALIDIDHFKQVNDTYGHPLGDSVLRCICGLLEAGLPAGAFCARYGGDEFAVVLPGSEQAAAVDVCEAARERIHRRPWDQLAAGLRVTVSVGVVHASGPALPEPLVESADALLYAAKDLGRNAVAFREDQSGAVRLAGAAGGRRTVRPFAGVPTPACDRTRSAP
jgi:diguanylate cyclase (GGDEF)-like protein